MKMKLMMKQNKPSKFRFVRFYWKAQEGTLSWLMQFLANLLQRPVVQTLRQASE